MKPGQAKPEDLLEQGSFPPELAWVPAHYRLHPDDPVYLLIAWHWRRVKQSEDTLAAAIVELRTLMDARIGTFAEATKAVQGVNALLAGVEATLAEKPAELSAQMEAGLTQPLDQALSRVQALEKSLAPLARSFERSQRRQVLASLLVGVALGVLAAVVLLLA